MQEVCSLKIYLASTTVHGTQIMNIHVTNAASFYGPLSAWHGTFATCGSRNGHHIWTMATYILNKKSTKDRPPA
jgi:hypothetical protein